MNTKTPRLVIFLSVLLTAKIHAFANIPVISGEQKLVGKYYFSYLFWDIYDVELYTSSGRYSANVSPLSLNFIYKINISSESFVSETEQQWKRFTLSESQKTAWLKRLSKILPDVIENDRVSFQINQSGETLFFHNKKIIGKIEEKSFGKAFVAIWLGKDGPYPDMTKALIGDVQ